MGVLHRLLNLISRLVKVVFDKIFGEALFAT
jgi:hypothetical protein